MLALTSLWIATVQIEDIGITTGLIAPSAQLIRVVECGVDLER